MRHSAAQANMQRLNRIFTGSTIQRFVRTSSDLIEHAAAQSSMQRLNRTCIDSIEHVLTQTYSGSFESPATQSKTLRLNLTCSGASKHQASESNTQRPNDTNMQCEHAAAQSNMWPPVQTCSGPIYHSAAQTLNTLRLIFSDSSEHLVTQSSNIQRRNHETFSGAIT